jgi:hypothetical protein
MGRAVGRVRGPAAHPILNADGVEHEAPPDGEVVPDTAYYRRAIADGSLELVGEV